MSGGHFEYQQYHIEDITRIIEHDLKKLKHTSELSEEAIKNIEGNWDSNIILIENYSTILEFKKAIKLLKKSIVYAQRIDWFMSGDDGEESFHSRLNKELKRLKKDGKR